MYNGVKDGYSVELHECNFYITSQQLRSWKLYFCKLNCISFKMFSLIQSFLWQGGRCCAWTARSWRGWESSRRRWGKRSSNRSSSCRSEKKSATCSSSAEVSCMLMCTHSDCGPLLRDRVDLAVKGWNNKKRKAFPANNVEYSSFVLFCVCVYCAGTALFAAFLLSRHQ